jgi:hypothetical protein
MSYALCLDYDNEVKTLRRIIQTSKRTQWAVEDIDWSVTSGGPYERILEWQGATRSSYVRALSPKKKEELARQFVAYDFSQILHGEQCAMMLAGQLISSVEDLDAKIYAATQAKDEARHCEAVKKIVHRIGPIYPPTHLVQKAIDDLLNCGLWPRQVLGLQLFLEARALISFRQHLLFVDDDVFQQVIRNVERDESQHVAFGMQYLRGGLESLTQEQRQETIEFGVWLDNNIWHLVDSGEYKAVFEQCDLDFAEFEATYRQTSFLKPSLSMSKASQKSMEAMSELFQRWFFGALFRVGLTEVIERRLGRKLSEKELETAELDSPTGLPWVKEEEPKKKRVRKGT